MENTLRLFRIIYKVALVTLLFLVCAIPFFTTLNIMTAFVLLPAFLIVLMTLSIFIDQKLNTIRLERVSATKQSNHFHGAARIKRCLLKKCLHKNCLG